MKTRGRQSSEYKVAWYAVIIGVTLAIAGVRYGSDLSDLGILIGVVLAPFSVYGLNRTALKIKQGEDIKEQHHVEITQAKKG